MREVPLVNKSLESNHQYDKPNPRDKGFEDARIRFFN